MDRNWEKKKTSSICFPVRLTHNDILSSESHIFSIFFPFVLFSFFEFFAFVWPSRTEPSRANSKHLFLWFSKCIWHVITVILLILMIGTGYEKHLKWRLKLKTKLFYARAKSSKIVKRKSWPQCIPYCIYRCILLDVWIIFSLFLLFSLCFL